MYTVHFKKVSKYVHCTVSLKGNSNGVSFTFRYRLYERKRATTIAIAIVGRAITIQREIDMKKHGDGTRDTEYIMAYVYCTFPQSKYVLLYSRS